jgi:ankyrin repeat protein
MVCKRWLDKFIVTLLHVSDFFPGYSGIARLLLSRGANVDLESSEGTPLHVSAARGKFGVMEILLEHHADVIINTNF